MTHSSISLRPMRADDGDALTQLALASPDTGEIQLAPRYHVDAYQAVVGLDSDVLGVVATLQGPEEVVGCGFVSFDQITYEGALRNCAWLHGLQVHPDYRRQGIAARLVSWRVEHARERIGEGVIGANIQRGNEGSFAIARSWQQYTAGELANGAISMRQKAPRALTGVSCRAAEPEEYEAIADGMNRFYAEYNFYPPQTAESLTNWLAKTPFDEPIRHYFVAVDSQNRILAGMGIAEEHRVIELEVQNLSRPLRMLNWVVKFVPVDGRMRQLSALKVWFAPGQLEVAQYLWETLRWEWRDRGGTVGFSFDGRGPLKQVFKMPFWMPETTFVLVVDAPVAPSESRLNYGG